MALSRFKEGELSGKIKDDVQLSLKKFRDGFDSSMADDLLTPPILSSFSDILKLINNNTSLLKVKFSSTLLFVLNMMFWTVECMGVKDFN